jgi:Cof subfamily protein (haloacid dehalogenase superfamily)
MDEMTSELRLFASDMDGTFLNDAHSYDREHFARVLSELTAAGRIFCAASGRQQLALNKLFDGFTDKIAFVAENGAYVNYKGESIFESTFSLGQLAELIKTLRANPYMTEDKILLSGRNGTYVMSSSKPTYKAKVKLYYANVHEFEDLSEVTDDIFKLNTNFPREKVPECEAWLNAEAPYVHATTTGFESIDIIPTGIDKGFGLRKLAEHFGWTAENVVAFGDQGNDLEMLQYAGTALAVENAIPELKAVATRVIGRNDDESVLKEMENLLTEKI